MRDEFKGREGTGRENGEARRGWGTKRGVGLWGGQVGLIQKPTLPPLPPSPFRSLSFAVPSLSPDNLCKVADETHSPIHVGLIVRISLHSFEKVIDRLKGYKLGACSSFLLPVAGFICGRLTQAQN